MRNMHACCFATLNVSQFFNIFVVMKLSYLLYLNLIMVGQGAAQACNQLKVLQEFRSSSVVKVNPDKPQEQARYCTLEVSVTHLLFSVIL